MFFKGKGFTHDPKRCKQCRGRRNNGKAIRKIEWGVKCAQCELETTVPFRPVRNEPVYCAECFAKTKVIPIRNP